MAGRIVRKAAGLAPGFVGLLRRQADGLSAAREVRTDVLLLDHGNALARQGHFLLGKRIEVLEPRHTVAAARQCEAAQRHHTAQAGSAAFLPEPCLASGSRPDHVSIALTCLSFRPTSRRNVANLRREGPMSAPPAP